MLAAMASPSNTVLRKNALDSLSFEGSKICGAKQAFD